MIPQDAGAHLAGHLAAIDKENFLARKNRSATKRWGAIHTTPLRLENPLGERQLGRILRAWGVEVKRNRKSPDPASGLSFRRNLSSRATRGGCRIGLARRRFFHWRLALLPSRGGAGSCILRTSKESRIPREQLAEAAQVNQTVRPYLVELEQQNPTDEPVHEQKLRPRTSSDWCGSSANRQHPLWKLQLS
jgi:hypothetical protein